MRIDCNRDQAVRFLPEGYHYHLQYQDMKHYKGWRCLSPSEKTFYLEIGTTKAHFWWLVTIRGSFDLEPLEKGTNVYQGSALCQTFYYLT